MSQPIFSLGIYLKWEKESKREREKGEEKGKGHHSIYDVIFLKGID